MDVFGRAPDYDTSADPVVRVRATEVRKRLSQYYGESANPDDVRFEMPSGAYHVEFHFPEPGAAAPAATIATPARRLNIPMAIGAIVLVTHRCSPGRTWSCAVRPRPPSIGSGPPSSIAPNQCCSTAVSPSCISSRAVSTSSTARRFRPQTRRGAYTVVLDPGRHH